MTYFIKQKKAILITVLTIVCALFAFACDSETEKNTPVSGITLDKTEISLYVGDTQTLNASVSPTDATNKKVNWSSSAPSIATVSSEGVVNAVSAGEATITAKTEDGQKTATCSLVVLSLADHKENAISILKSEDLCKGVFGGIMGAPIYSSIEEIVLKAETDINEASNADEVDELFNTAIDEIIVVIFDDYATMVDETAQEIGKDVFEGELYGEGYLMVFFAFKDANEYFQNSVLRQYASLFQDGIEYCQKFAEEINEIVAEQAERYSSYLGLDETFNFGSTNFYFTDLWDDVASAVAVDLELESDKGIEDYFTDWLANEFIRMAEANISSLSFDGFFESLDHEIFCLFTRDFEFMQPKIDEINTKIASKLASEDYADEVASRLIIHLVDPTSAQEPSDSWLGKYVSENQSFDDFIDAPDLLMFFSQDAIDYLKEEVHLFISSEFSSLADADSYQDFMESFVESIQTTLSLNPTFQEYFLTSNEIVIFVHIDYGEEESIGYDFFVLTYSFLAPYPGFADVYALKGYNENTNDFTVIEIPGIMTLTYSELLVEIENAYSDFLGLAVDTDEDGILDILIAENFSAFLDMSEYGMGFSLPLLPAGLDEDATMAGADYVLFLTAVYGTP